MINNLAQLKRALKKDARLEIIRHFRAECVGQVRRVTVANTVCFYSVVDGQPDHKISRSNGGRGSVLYWSKAPFWTFQDGVCSLYNDKGHEPKHLIMAFRVLDDAA